MVSGTVFGSLMAMVIAAHGNAVSKTQPKIAKRATLPSVTQVAYSQAKGKAYSCSYEILRGEMRPALFPRKLTRNRMGWVSGAVSELSEAWVEDCKGAGEGLSLDIGAAFGAACVEVLWMGARVAANDLDEGHLEELRGLAGAGARLEVKPGHFPGGLHFEAGSLWSVHMSNVAHFLTGKKLEYGLRLIRRWLRPGGRLYLQAVAPFPAVFARFPPGGGRPGGGGGGGVGPAAPRYSPSPRLVAPGEPPDPGEGDARAARGGMVRGAGSRPRPADDEPGPFGVVGDLEPVRPRLRLAEIPGHAASLRRSAGERNRQRPPMPYSAPGRPPTRRASP